ncbi:SPASM domain-containing protein [Desulfoscipio geothermicus]|uniref:Radical SAM additional 4Fe4S-binding SPASM domain-containing protein n=1 Tax=Desulfoscipio geothermicus DSM 3669 TaxID=1121426 RepID=A0A1I6DSX1_9FIRM|nr:SPASM domain-containing protein [Desulfoscipio geothermicus]SFR08545.1 radical SAM additional 4Fe4S-binding SPASM domain-containing protein [Desulfoscipio geothermicus DSM 3669]
MQAAVKVLTPQEERIIKGQLTEELTTEEGRNQRKRVNKLLANFRSRPPRVNIERALLFTESFKETESMPMVLRWAKAMENILNKIKFVEDKAMVVNHMGFVSPCYALMHSYNCYIYGRIKEMYPFYLGNVTEKKLDQIWTEPIYINFRLAVNNFHFPSCTDCKFLDGCSYVDNNDGDCWGNSPSCAECLWSRQLVLCP